MQDFRPPISDASVRRVAQKIAPLGPAEEMIEQVRRVLADFRHILKENEVERMFCASAFGIVRVLSMHSVGKELVQMTIRDGGGEKSVIVMHVAQCAIQVEIASVKAKEEKNERVITGFNVPKTEAV